ncbi:hypothetical protein AB8A21_04270 [Streptomyces sp. BF23-18]|uniref:hypothetical protein n=1 Tax=Streptomyces sp. BF23-18 TaxID=3240282 RepID=UPI0034E51DA6
MNSVDRALIKSADDATENDCGPSFKNARCGSTGSPESTGRTAARRAREGDD